MTVDYLPAVRSFAVERIRSIKANPSDSINRDDGAIDELQMIITLCDGLGNQQEMIYDAWGKAGKLVDK